MTDTRHLDAYPRYELIDALDADANGRGDLLFRQYSDVGITYWLYRVSAYQIEKDLRGWIVTLMRAFAEGKMSARERLCGRRLQSNSVMRIAIVLIAVALTASVSRCAGISSVRKRATPRPGRVAHRAICRDRRERSRASPRRSKFSTT